MKKPALISDSIIERYLQLDVFQLFFDIVSLNIKILDMIHMFLNYLLQILV